MLDGLKQWFRKNEKISSLEDPPELYASSPQSDRHMRTIINTPSPRTHMVRRQSIQRGHYWNGSRQRILKKRFFGARLQDVQESDMIHGIPIIMYRCVEALIRLNGKMEI
jgi:hypothetical protein